MSLPGEGLVEVELTEGGYLRRDAELALDDTIEVWLGLTDGLRQRLEPYLSRVAAETLASDVHLSEPPPGAPASEVDLDGGRARVGLARTSGHAA